MSNYDYFNTWGYVDGVGDYIPMSSVDEKQVQDLVDKSLKTTELTQDGQELQLSIDGENVSTVTIEDKYLRDVTLNEETKELVFKVDDGIEEKSVDLSGMLAEYATKEEVKNIESMMKNFKLKEGDEMVDVIKKGGDVTLMSDVKSSTDITMVRDAVVELNGHEMNAVGGKYGDNVVIGNGAEIVLKNGVVNPAETASEANASSTIIVKTSQPSKLTLDGMTVIGQPYGIYLNNSSGKAEVTINSGTYYTNSTTANAPAVYIQKPGKVTINGGTFGKAGENNAYVLNLLDKLRHEGNDLNNPLIEGFDPRQYIEVKGGSFYNFDPSNNGAEGANTNFVADGYEVIAETVGNDTIYKVVAKA